MNFVGWQIKKPMRKVNMHKAVLWLLDCTVYVDMKWWGETTGRSGFTEQHPTGVMFYSIYWRLIQQGQNRSDIISLLSLFQNPCCCFLDENTGAAPLKQRSTIDFLKAPHEEPGRSYRTNKLRVVSDTTSPKSPKWFKKCAFYTVFQRVTVE